METDYISNFIKHITQEINIQKCLKENDISKLISIFPVTYKKLPYLNEIEKPIMMALQFYSDYDMSYYNLLRKGLQTEKIMILSDANQSSSFVSNGGIAVISLSGRDIDLFLLVHEFAHFIDVHSKPHLTPDSYCHLSEVFAFYMEKQLESWLPNLYLKLIQTRKNNRIVAEARMLQAIQYVLFCEALYRKTGTLKKEDLEEKQIQSIMRYSYDAPVGFVNSLLRYPIANILSQELITQDSIPHQQIWEWCLSQNLNDILKLYEEAQVSQKVYGIFNPYR